MAHYNQHNNRSQNKKYPQKRSSVLLVMALALLFGCGAQKSKPLPGRVFIYEKSNLDGSNKGKIAVYYEGFGQIESFKWHEGNKKGTKVSADMDPNSHTVKHFEVFRVDHLGNEQLSAVLDVAEDGTIKINLGEHEQLFDAGPEQWHSYDFDFASLGYAYPMIKEKDKPISFNVLDLDLKESPPQLKDFGEVEMRFLEQENKWSRNLLKYTIDGPGLDHRGGHIWFEKSEGYLVAFEIEKPDEPGYKSGKLLLKEVLPMKKQDWPAFKKAALNKGH
nr:hypothetical protein [Allomuricauda sp.]